MGLLLDPTRPALAGFPTQAHSDWQWQELIDGGQAVVLPADLADGATLVEFITDFHDPARAACLFEVRVGPGKLLVCGLDLIGNLGQRHTARALRASLLTYAASDAFDPAAELTVHEAEALLSAAAFGGGNITSISADSAAAEHTAANALDGDPATFWHTPWGAVQPTYPHHLVLDLGEPRDVVGLNLLARPDSRNGRIAELAIYTSDDGQNWGAPIHRQTLEDTAEVQQVRFTPVQTRYLKLEARSEVTGQDFASLAELEVVETPSR